MMKTCSVCGSDKLHEFHHTHSQYMISPTLSTASVTPAFWCEDCGSMHTHTGASQPKQTWEDRDDEWSEDIRDSHPSRTGTHDEWATAMKMVGNRHSKSALVALVHFLLVEKKIYAESAKRLQALTETSPLHEQVLEFHKRFGQSIGDKPHVIDTKTLRFRLSLIKEEFLELFDAASDPTLGCYRDEARIALENTIELADADGVDLPAFVDALADLAYVMEGTAISMGVNMTPIAEEVHRANMAKLPSYVAAKDATHWVLCRHDIRRIDCAECGGESVAVAAVKRADGKIMKPEGWKPPDIEGILKAQGWKP